MWINSTWTTRTKPSSEYDADIIYDSNIAYDSWGTVFYPREQFNYHNQAVTLNGTDKAMLNSTAQSIEIENSWSIEFWFATSSSAPTWVDTFFNIWNGSDTKNSIDFSTASWSLTGCTFTIEDTASGNQKQYAFDLSASTIYHSIFTWDGTDLTIYLNGSEVSVTKTIDQALTMDDVTWREIKIWSLLTASQYADIIVCSMTVWNWEITSSEVTSLYYNSVWYKQDNTSNYNNYNSSLDCKHYWNLWKDTSDIWKDYWNASTTIDIDTNAENISASDVWDFQLP